MPCGPPDLTDEQVVEIVRRVACSNQFSAHPRCQENFRAMGYDLDRVAELLAECTTDELEKHEPDYGYPMRQCYIAVFDILDYGQPIPFYIKVALHLPGLNSGYLLSFRVRT